MVFPCFYPAFVCRIPCFNLDIHWTALRSAVYAFGFKPAIEAFPLWLIQFPRLRNLTIGKPLTPARQSRVYGVIGVLVPVMNQEPHFFVDVQPAAYHEGLNQSVRVISPVDLQSNILV